MVWATSPTTVVPCDDHQVLTEGLSAILSVEYDILVCELTGSVGEPFDMVDRRVPGVVLVEYALPDGGGVAATRALQQAHRQIHVVMLMSCGDHETLVAAIGAGCSGFDTRHSGSRAVAGAIGQVKADDAVRSVSGMHQLLPKRRPTHRGLGADLTARELEILELLADGVSGRAIAERLFLSFNTVRNHAQRVLDKLGVHSRLGGGRRGRPGRHYPALRTRRPECGLTQS